MKNFVKIGLIILFCGSFFNGLAQPGRGKAPLHAEKQKQKGIKVDDSSVPQVAKDALQKKYPGVSAEWYQRDKGEGKGKKFWAVFKNSNGNEILVKIRADGDIKKSITVYKPEQLPAAIQSAISKKYPDMKIIDAVFVEDFKENTSAFRIVLIKSSIKIITFMDSNGNEVDIKKFEQKYQED